MTDADRRGRLLDSYENAAVIVSGIDAEELDYPTPCRKYEVAGLIDHDQHVSRRARQAENGLAVVGAVFPGRLVGSTGIEPDQADLVDLQPRPVTVGEDDVGD